ncbi:hypothetical protein KBD75_03960 [Candidatus Woesebacteria bacterium]|nr:hypothetical protein [Candidatus Woesebacteria bacterium]
MTETDNRRLRGFYLKFLHEHEDTGYACTGNARLILEEASRELGLKGDIYEVMSALEEKAFRVSHSYVVLESQDDISPALNQPMLARELMPVKMVKIMGKKITQTIMSADMNTLK